MNEDRAVELLIELHQGLARLGPGEDEATLRALALCRPLASRPRVLDIGCGTGAQTRLLAAVLDGSVVATDRCHAFLAQMRATLVTRGLDRKVAIVVADMHQLPFAAQSFDLIWSEGAIYNMGFDAGLDAWRDLARPGAFLVVSELCWFVSEPAEDVRAFWAGAYPAMRGVAANADAAARHGWGVVDHFTLPVRAWTESYYRYLAERIPPFRARYPDDPEAQAIADQTLQEMALLAQHPSDCGYELFVLRRPD